MVHLVLTKIFSTFYMNIWTRCCHLYDVDSVGLWAGTRCINSKQSQLCLQKSGLKICGLCLFVVPGGRQMGPHHDFHHAWILKALVFFTIFIRPINRISPITFTYPSGTHNPKKPHSLHHLYNLSYPPTHHDHHDHHLVCYTGASGKRHTGCPNSK